MKTITHNHQLLFCFLFLSLSFAGFEKEFQTKLILAELGDTLKIPSGTQILFGTLSLNGKENIVISGNGIDQSILSFKTRKMALKD